jgi:hypothetical protein
MKTTSNYFPRAIDSGDSCLTNSKAMRNWKMAIKSHKK